MEEAAKRSRFAMPTKKKLAQRTQKQEPYLNHPGGKQFHQICITQQVKHIFFVRNKIFTPHLSGETSPQQQGPYATLPGSYR